MRADSRGGSRHAVPLWDTNIKGGAGFMDDRRMRKGVGL